MLRRVLRRGGRADAVSRRRRLRKLLSVPLLLLVVALHVLLLLLLVVTVWSFAAGARARVPNVLEYRVHGVSRLGTGPPLKTSGLNFRLTESSRSSPVKA